MRWFFCYPRPWFVTNSHVCIEQPAYFHHNAELFSQCETTLTCAPANTRSRRKRNSSRLDLKLQGRFLAVHKKLGQRLQSLLGGLPPTFSPLHLLQTVRRKYKCSSLGEYHCGTIWLNHSVQTWFVRIKENTDLSSWNWLLVFSSQSHSWKLRNGVNASASSCFGWRWNLKMKEETKDKSWH